jgi:hypothetical protein
VSLALKLVGVVESDSWSVVYRDVSSDGKQWVSLVSWPMTWEMLSAGEQQSFSRKPLDMTAFVRPS